MDLQQKTSVRDVPGTCNDTAQTMNISFTANNVNGDMWIYLTFVQSSGSFLLDSVSVGYPSDNSIRMISCFYYSRLVVCLRGVRLNASVL